MGDLGPDTPGEAATPEAALVDRVNRFRVVLLDRLEAVETELAERGAQVAALHATAAETNAALAACRAERDDARAAAESARESVVAMRADAEAARADGERTAALAARHGEALAQIYRSRSWRLSGAARSVAEAARRAARR